MRCHSSLARVACALLALTATAQSAVAAGPYVFFARDDSTTSMTSFPNSQAEFNHFTTFLTSFGVDGAESTPGFDPAPVLTFGATGITAATQGVIGFSTPGFMIGNFAFPEYDAAIDPTPGGQVNTAFLFNQPITAVGLFLIQGGDVGNNNPITFRLEGSGTKDVTVQVGPGWGFDNVFFIGLADTDPFTKLTLLETGDVADGTLYDNVVAGFFVPEPSSLALLTIGGAAALYAVARRRRRNG